MQAEPDRQVQNDADNRCSDGSESTGKAWTLADRVDVGRTGKDEEEARCKGHLERDDGTDDPGPDAAELSISREVADKLGDEDQRAGRGFCKAEAVDHLVRREPPLILNCRLPHVGQHGIGSAECYNRELREEDADLRQHMGRAEKDR